MSLNYCIYLFVLCTAAKPQDWICTCTCKAGAGGKCKHVLACLLFINRYVDSERKNFLCKRILYYRNELEQLSCTDLQQTWGKRKHIGYSDPVYFTEFCHIQKRNNITPRMSPELAESVFQEYVNGKKLLIQVTVQNIRLIEK